MELHPSHISRDVCALPLLGSIQVNSSTRCLRLFSRSYFILRTKETSDPDPKIVTLLLHIWPLMIFIALADLVILAIAAGLLGIHIFTAFPIVFVFNFLVLRYFCRDLPSGETPDPEAGAEQRKEKTEESQHFIALAALSTIWLPCVVGKYAAYILP